MLQSIPKDPIALTECSSAKALVRLPEVQRLSGLSRSTIYRLEACGGFPSRVRLSERAIAWRSEEVQTWLDARPRASTHLERQSLMVG